MRQLFLSLLFGVMTLVSVQAQAVGGRVTALRSVISRSVAGTTSSSGNLIHKLQQQSRSAQQAVRNVETAGLLKIKPSIFPVVVPDTDTDDRDNKINNLKIRPIVPQLLNLKPLPRIKTFNELLDGLIAREYENAKLLVAQGKYDLFPFLLFRHADYAKRHGDDAFAVECIEHIDTKQLSPGLLKKLSGIYPALSEYMPEISRSVAIYAYSMMVDAKLKGPDCDSLRMQSGDTLLMVTGKYNPSLNPLVALSCFYDPDKEIERYKEVADSVIVTYDQWSDAFKDTFACDFLLTLMNKGEYATALDYFGREPLKQFPDSQVSFDLDLATSAMATQNDSLFASYIDHALALDSVATNDYWTRLYDLLWAQYIADPSQTELADWLLEFSPMPTNNALALSDELIECYWPETESSWEWQDIHDLNPDQIIARQAILYILDKATAIDEGRSEPDIVPYCSYIKAGMMAYDPTLVADAGEMFGRLAAVNLPELRCFAVISEAYIAAHGLDKPKDALKILKKNLRLLEDPAVSADIRDMWYDYMAALYTSIGKTKDAEKYRKLINKIAN